MAEEIDGLLLSDPELEVLGITYERQATDTGLPGWNPVDDDSNPCQQSKWVAVLQPWNAFRQVRSSGFSNVAVVQSVALYANPSAAQAVFKKFADAAAACQAKNGPEIYSVTSPREVAWSQPTQNEVGEYAGNIAAWNVRLVENVIVYVTSARDYEGVGIVAKLADHIVAKATLT
ncbi:sensor domain-containing protein [Mycobacteroides abscessus subsp. bolletii]|uniref:sensor domain-containing protein n=1 Tax=Mycobacteroides abscessus TaxID=36809 RepID=UPI00266B6E59|nr:sensor domain-containing protein [Mycobacteroides abscessus]MDO3126528.1 sensor domain-containing protein [Mycobacteroides abscessus subsp. bolletii]